MSAIYREMYGNEDGSIPATFEVIHMVGWKPDPSQPKPAARGSATHSLKDLGDITKHK
jgi:NADH dehydrogenase [ubiquinone] 1 alpha subcomplex assembly factor 5